MAFGEVAHEFTVAAAGADGGVDGGVEGTVGIVAFFDEEAALAKMGLELVAEVAVQEEGLDEVNLGGGDGAVAVEFGEGLGRFEGEESGRIGVAHAKGFEDDGEGPRVAL